MVDDAVHEYERAHARPVARVRGRVGSGHSRVLSDGLRDLRRIHHMAAALVVVFDAALALLLLSKRNVEVEVEIGLPQRRRPRETSTPSRRSVRPVQLREAAPADTAEEA